MQEYYRWLIGNTKLITAHIANSYNEANSANQRKILQITKQHYGTIFAIHQK